MALFKVNTGTREQEIASCAETGEIKVPELGTSVSANFGGRIKHSGEINGEDRLIVLNDVGRSVVESCQGKHPEWVFTFENKPVGSMNNPDWWEDESGPQCPDGPRIGNIMSAPISAG